MAADSKLRTHAALVRGIRRTRGRVSASTREPDASIESRTSNHRVVQHPAKSAPPPASRGLRPAHLRRARVVIVASEFNGSVTRALVDGATAALTERGVPRKRIQVCWVPGAFELPFAAAAAALAKPDAIVALGCLIRGQTPQYEAIGHAVAIGLQQVSVAMRVPVGFGVIIADSAEQARARAGGRAGHRGREAALAAAAMIGLKSRLQPSG